MAGKIPDACRVGSLENPQFEKLAEEQASHSLSVESFQLQQSLSLQASRLVTNRVDQIVACQSSGEQPFYAHPNTPSEARTVNHNGRQKVITDR